MKEKGFGSVSRSKREVKVLSNISSITIIVAKFLKFSLIAILTILLKKPKLVRIVVAIASKFCAGQIP